MSMREIMAKQMAKGGVRLVPANSPINLYTEWIKWLSYNTESEINRYNYLNKKSRFN